VRKAFARETSEEISRLEKLFRQSSIDFVSLSTDKPYIGDIRALFRRRSGKRRGR
jgi:hypothetical protein